MNRKTVMPIILILTATVIFSFSSCGKKNDGAAEKTTERGTTKTFSTTNNNTTDSAAESTQTTAVTTPETKQTETQAPTKDSVNETQKTETETVKKEDNAVNSAVGSFSSSDMAVTINGVTLRPNTAWSNYSSSFGAPDNTTQAPSCHFDGMDNIYEYNGFSIYTYRNNGEDYIYDIEITSKSIPTAKGIRTGSSESDVIAAYGNAYTSKTESLIEYRSGNSSIYFTMNNGTVTTIEFYCD